MEKIMEQIMNSNHISIKLQAHIIPYSLKISFDMDRITIKNLKFSRYFLKIEYLLPKGISDGQGRASLAFMLVDVPAPPAFRPLVLSDHWWFLMVLWGTFFL